MRTLAAIPIILASVFVAFLAVQPDDASAQEADYTCHSGTLVGSQCEIEGPAPYLQAPCPDPENGGGSVFYSDGSSGLAAGCYESQFRTSNGLCLPGFVDTSPNQCTLAVTATGPAEQTCPGGFELEGNRCVRLISARCTSLSVTVWIDDNADGIRQNGETVDPVPSFTVIDDATEAEVTLVDDRCVPPGSYVVQVNADQLTVAGVDSQVDQVTGQSAAIDIPSQGFGAVQAGVVPAVPPVPLTPSFSSPAFTCADGLGLNLQGGTAPYTVGFQIEHPPSGGLPTLDFFPGESGDAGVYNSGPPLLRHYLAGVTYELDVGVLDATGRSAALATTFNLSEDCMPGSGSGCVDDIREQNDYQAEAFALALGVNESLQVCFFDHDWFSFDANVGDQIVVATSENSGGSGVNVAIYDPADNPAAVHFVDADSNNPFVFVADTAGTYDIEVFSANLSDNTYSLQTLPPACVDDGFEDNDNGGEPTALSLGIQESLHICQHDPDWFTFPVTAGDTIDVELLFAEEIDETTAAIFFSLFAPSQLGVSAADGVYPAGETLTHVATETGNYLLVIAELGGVESAYDLTVTATAPPAPCALGAATSTNTALTQDECSALVTFYTETDGTNWNDNTGWTAITSGGQTDPCDWAGVICSVNSSELTRLVIFDNGLTGSIPAELADLVNLELLSLTNNGLTGEIPPELGELSNLRHLYLDRNALTGSIPPQLGDLSNLEQLFLDENALSGPIPPELGDLSSLLDLFLSGNVLSGSIPPELGDLTNLEQLYLDKNVLSGSIPPELGGLSNLNLLRLRENNLSGLVPPQIQNLASLQPGNGIWLVSNGCLTADAETTAWLATNFDPAFATDALSVSCVDPNFISQSSAFGFGNESGDEFGEVVVSGDFDGDGFEDVAVGSPHEDGDFGAVTVFFGSVTGLLEAEPVSVAVTGWRFGAALAAGDVAGGLADELVIGSPWADVDNHGAAGSVGVYSLVGRTAIQMQRFDGDAAGVTGSAESGDFFGSALVVDDFNGDGLGDVAVGAPGEALGSKDEAGAVIVFYGNGSGVATQGSKWISGDSSGVPGSGEQDDLFGSALAAGDFDGNGTVDLAVGVPGEALGSKTDAGAVIVFDGTASGVVTSGAQWISGSSAGVTGTGETGDRFGSALVAANFNGSGPADLAVGSPGEALGSKLQAGAVIVFYGANGSGLATSGSKWVSGDSAGVTGSAEAGDLFGSSLAAGDFDGNGTVDLVIGSPGEALGSKAEAGAVIVFDGTASGIVTQGSQWISGDSGGLPGVGETGDLFGASLAMGNFDGQTTGLVIGSPGEGLGGITDTGAIMELPHNYPN